MPNRVYTKPIDANQSPIGYISPKVNYSLPFGELSRHWWGT